jgi:cation diffusion facilitator CzcD-associated flavoprotein CzcO
VFQRTPPWVMPHSNRPITDWERRLYRRVPALQKLMRGGVYAGRELLVFGFVKNPRLMGVVEHVARRHMRGEISDPALLEKVTPDYTIGCKRILPSNRWYRALTKDNVELVTGGVEEVRPRSVVGADGVEREVDAIIFGTGFQVTDIPAAHRVRGRGGTLLDDVWHGSPRAYMGTSIAGFPNLFFLLGPNTGLGHSSMVYMIESQVAHVMKVLGHMRSRGAETVEIRPEAQARYNADIDGRMKGTVWQTGCSSWYLDRTGRNATIWPDWTWQFRRRATELRTEDYALDVRMTTPAPVAA